MRASDAHSWVEVYFPSFGWLTFDPTPPSDEKPPGLFAGLGRYWDWFELQWSEWVINYDFLHQFTLAQNLHRVSLDWTQRLRTAFMNARRIATSRLERWQSRIARAPSGIAGRPLRLLAVFFVTGLLLQPKVRRRLMTLWHLRISSAAEMTPHLATIQYNEMLRLLSRRYPQGRGADPTGICLVVAGRKSVRGRVHELTGMYQAARFGGQASDPRQKASSLLNRHSVVTGLSRSSR